MSASQTSGTDPSYSVDNYDADVGKLYFLLEAAMDTLLDLDYGAGPPRNVTLDRAAALVHIARDMTKHMLDQRDLR